ncbi:MAG: coenzyme F420-0:L-glutamate ligase [Nitrosopumilus sp.]|nr:coenzyme F420-0:L-glutamate ligase [Nitrososphaerota archaeon]MCH8085019.1 coenzyme F420-0:L-glutamate ligase [Nitrososphaerota archaeon]
MQLTVLPLLAERMKGEFDVFETLLETLEKNNTKLQDGDVLVISTKYISNSQGRIIELEKIRASDKGIEISKKFQLKPEIAEIIIRESDKIFGGIGGFVITSSDNIMAPNAGIDKSNVKKGSVILYPTNPYLIAEQIRRKIFLKLSIHVGIILVDSRLMPARIGTSGVAVACAGIEPVLDMRAKKDLDGNPLKVTFQAVVDNLATIANHKMGEGAESKPFAIVRNSDAKLTDRKINSSEMAISPDQCVYVRGLSNSGKN